MDVIAAIQTAIEEERTAQEKYRGLAAAAKDAETRIMFEQMVKEEELHEKRLRDKLKALKLLRHE